MSFIFGVTKVCRVLLINIAAFYKNVAISQISATETVLFVGYSNVL